MMFCDRNFGFGHSSSEKNLIKRFIIASHTPRIYITGYLTSNSLKTLLSAFDQPYIYQIHLLGPQGSYGAAKSCSLSQELEIIPP